MHRGWYQIAFERDLVEGLNEAKIGDRVIALVKQGARVRAFDGFCPHRGANLCRGGTLVGNAIRCPFHGLLIGLSSMRDGFSAREYTCLVYSGLVFVRESDGEDHGFSARFCEIDANGYVVPGFALHIAAPPELVIENAFDAMHFRTVHAIGNSPTFELVESAQGFAVEGRFLLPASPWQKARLGERHVDVAYRATAYSPTLVISDLGGDKPYSMLTATVPAAEGGCVVRLSLLMPPGPGAAAPDAAACRYLIAGAERGLNEDRPIWEAMARPERTSWTPEDHAVVAFRRFCEAVA